MTASPSSEFAEAIGRAVIAWREVEKACAALFVSLIDARNRDGALTAFHAVHSANVRAVMLKSAARAMFSNSDFEDLEQDFNKLMDRLGDASRLRNRLSHSDVEEHLTPEGWTYSLTTPEHEAEAAGFLKGGSKPRHKKTTVPFEPIKGADAEFHALAQALTDLAALIDERLAEV